MPWGSSRGRDTQYTYFHLDFPLGSKWQGASGFQANGFAGSVSDTTSSTLHTRSVNPSMNSWSGSLTREARAGPLEHGHRHANEHISYDEGSDSNP
jgi:hypothetical protein